jgi:hypothetical protein
MIGLSQSGNFLPLMELKVSFPSVQESATGPCPQPDQPSPDFNTCSFKMSLHIIPTPKHWMRLHGEALNYPALRIQSNFSSSVTFTPYFLTPWCRIWFEKLTVTKLVKKYPAFFMEPEGSLQCSQKPATGLYPEPAESSSPHRSLSP